MQFFWLKVEDFKENPELIEVAKVLIETKEWRWLRNVGRFLVMLGDDEVKSIFQRYSSGNFTEEEVEVNKNSKEDMIIFAQGVLKEYKESQ